MNFKSIRKALEFAIDKEKEAVAFYSGLSKKESIADKKSIEIPFPLCYHLV